MEGRKGLLPLSTHILFPPPFAVSARLASFRPSHASRVSPGCGRQCIAERARRQGQGLGGQKRKSFVAFLRRRWNCVAVKVAGNQKRITFSAPTKEREEHPSGTAPDFHLSTPFPGTKRVFLRPLFRILRTHKACPYRHASRIASPFHVQLPLKNHHPA